MDLVFTLALSLTLVFDLDSALTLVFDLDLVLTLDLVLDFCWRGAAWEGVFLGGILAEKLTGELWKVGEVRAEESDLSWSGKLQLVIQQKMTTCRCFYCLQWCIVVLLSG